MVTQEMVNGGEWLMRAGLTFLFFFVLIYTLPSYSDIFYNQNDNFPT